ncbi:porin [Burkholderia sp. S171]|uniref:porin n=1 Tax=Burkholderia sp. S171 TaxID=1641860 RepID=UPI00131C2163|nr:porin [Burkholderia sp. S171]
MKKIAFAASILGVSLSVHAQSSVTLFGQLNEGFAFVTNEQGKHLTALQDSYSFPSVFGFQGSEDLGGGTKAVFQLVSQFSVGTGALITPGTLFNRVSLVGLSNENYGKITVGNQYSFMMDNLLFAGYDGAYNYGGLYNLRQGPFAKLGIPQNPTGAFEFDSLGAAGVNNTVKYVSPNFHGFSGGAQYGFGGVAGAFNADRSMSFGLNYQGTNFSAALAYLEKRYPSMDNGLDGIRNFGAGIKYNLYNVTLSALFTDTQNTLTGAKVWVVQGGAQRWLNDAWLLGIDYQYMKGNSQLSNNKANQVSAGVQYWLSKRTDIYLIAAFQQAGGDGPAYAWLNGLSQSSSSRQAAMNIGLATRF